MTLQSYSPEEFEREFSTDASPSIVGTNALSAILRSAGEVDFDIAKAPDYLRKDATEATGCRFIDSTYFLLEYIKCPPDVRELVLVICGLSGGDYKNFVEITQAKMAQRMGVTTETIRNRFKSLWDWERRSTRMVVEIEEGEYEPKNKRYQPTKYRAAIVYYSAEFMRRVEERGLKPLHRIQAATEKTEELLDEIADDVAAGMPIAPILKPRKTRNVTPPQPRMSFIEGKEIKLLRDTQDWRNALINAQYDPTEYEEELIGRIRNVIRYGMKT